MSSLCHSADITRRRGFLCSFRPDTGRVANYAIARQTVGTLSGGSDDVTVAGEGWPSAALLFLPHAVTNGTVREEAGLGIGMTDFGGMGSMESWSGDNLTTTITRTSSSGTRAIGVTRNAIPVTAAATASKVSNGLRLTWSLDTAVADFLLTGLMFGGSGTRVKSAYHDPGSIGEGTSQNVSIGFRPDVIFFASNGQATEVDVTSNHRLSFGAAARSGNQLAVSSMDNHNVASSDSTTHVSTIRSLARVGPLGTLSTTLEVTAFTSDGFQITSRDGIWSWDFIYLALQLPRRVACGRVDLPTTAGNFDITTVGFRPRVVMQALSSNSLFDAAVNADTVQAISVFDGTSEFTSGCVVTNGVATSDTHSISVDKAAHVMNGNGTTMYQGDFVSFLDNGYRINYTNVASVSRKGFYVAFE